MFYLFKFSDSISLYDSDTQTTRALDKADSDCLKKLFPTMFPENMILSAVAVTSIQPNKLSKLTTLDKSNGSAKKLFETSKQ